MMRVTLQLGPTLERRVRELMEELDKPAPETVAQVLANYFQILDDLESGHAIMAANSMD